MTPHTPRHLAAQVAETMGRAHRLLGEHGPGDETTMSLLDWLRGSLTRRIVLLAIGEAITIAFALSGVVKMPPSVFVIFGAWLTTAIVLFALFRSEWAAAQIWRMHIFAWLMDLAGVLLVTHAMGATLWYAPLLLAVAIGLGGQTLPRLQALLLGFVGSAGFAFTLFAEIRGWWPTSGPLASSAQPTMPQAIAAVIIVTVILIAIATIQRGFYRQIAGAEARHARVLEAARDIILTIDLNGHFVSANVAVEEQLGWMRTKLIGDHFIGYVDDRDKEHAVNEFSRIMQGETVKTDVRVVAANGDVHMLSAMGSPIRDEKGKVVALLGIARDVTQIRADAQRLSESERKLRLLVQSVTETVFTLDTNLRFTAVYGRWAPDAPVRAADVIGKTSDQVLAPVFGDAFVRPLERALLGERVDIEHDVSTDAESRWYHLSFAPLQEDDGRIIGVTGVAFDISEQRRAEIERDALRGRLEESRRGEALGRLVSGVAHEINNPLTTIIAFAEQLRTESRNAMDTVALEAIHAQAMRSRAVVRDLIAFIRPTTQRPSTLVRPDALIDTTLRSVLPHLMSLGAELTTDVSAQGVWIAADAPALEQVITNLVLNAAQAAGPGGRVNVRSVVTEKSFTLIVEDTGPGIRPDVFPHLFEPFFTTRPVGEGTGLGLFVARGTVHRHGATLRGENRPQRDGGGARFIAEFPRASTPPGGVTPVSVRAQSVPRAALPASARGRVMLVDDEESIRTSLHRFFTHKGWDVVEASDGAEALAVLRTPEGDTFTMVLCDLRMPGMGGAELHARLVEEAPRVIERLVVVSGDVVSPAAAAFVASSKCRLLEKPFELKTLAALAEEMLLLQLAGAEAGARETHGNSAA